MTVTLNFIDPNADVLEETEVVIEEELSDAELRVVDIIDQIIGVTDLPEQLSPDNSQFDLSEIEDEIVIELGFADAGDSTETFMVTKIRDTDKLGVLSILADPIFGVETESSFIVVTYSP